MKAQNKPPFTLF